MTFRERIPGTFGHEKIDRLVWQPRLEHWYDVNKGLGRLPERYKDKSILEVYDDLGASVRYYGGPFLDFSYNNVKITTKKTPQFLTILYETPLGNLKEIHEFTEWGHSTHVSEYPVKTVKDMKVMEYILRDSKVTFNYENFYMAEKEIGERGVVQFFLPRSPLQRLIICYMGFENTIFALRDSPKEMNEFLQIIDETDNELYEVLHSAPVRILNFGENIDANLNAPPLFEQYFIPYYKKRIRQLHSAGKFCHIHMDGSLKPLLQLMNKAGFDGIEAATPIPQGDVTLEELKKAMGETILLDGMPGILFLPQYSYKDLKAFVSKIIDIFSPNLILGISDELPPGGDIEKVRLISEIIDGI